MASHLRRSESAPLHAALEAESQSVVVGRLLRRLVGLVCPPSAEPAVFELQRSGWPGQRCDLEAEVGALSDLTALLVRAGPARWGPHHRPAWIGVDTDVRVKCNEITQTSPSPQSSFRRLS